MSKNVKRWPTWKIAAGGIGCIGAAAGLFWLSVFLGRVEGLNSNDADTGGVLALPGFVLILGMAASMLALLSFVWFGLRIKEARTPPWERKTKSKRR